ncbi:hypothetical protein HanRHA438_Chr01g0038651 [Helianthus annuus]|nr:hypothetical protein HanRHA438_Chr01g0038651 [Helianthus annuus]
MPSLQITILSGHWLELQHKNHKIKLHKKSRNHPVSQTLERLPQMGFFSNCIEGFKVAAIYIGRRFRVLQVSLHMRLPFNSCLGFIL